MRRRTFIAGVTAAALVPAAAADAIPRHLVALGSICLLEMADVRRMDRRMLAGSLAERLAGRRLRDAVAADFRRGDARLVDGWLLSNTEILLAALAHRTFG